MYSSNSDNCSEHGFYRQSFSVQLHNKSIVSCAITIDDSAYNYYMDVNKEYVVSGSFVTLGILKWKEIFLSLLLYLVPIAWSFWS